MLTILAIIVLPFLVIMVLPRILLRKLTKGRVNSRRLPYYEVFDENAAELKARRLVAEVRREAAKRQQP